MERGFAGHAAFTAVVFMLILIIATPAFSAAPLPDLEIKKIYPRNFDVEKGAVRYVSIDVENTGETELRNVTSAAENLTGWFEPENIIPSIQRGGEDTVMIKFEVPYNASTGEYRVVLRIYSLEDMEFGSVNISVYGSLEDLARNVSAKLKRRISELESEVNLSESPSVRKLLERARNNMIMVDETISQNKWMEALTRIGGIEETLDNAEKIISGGGGEERPAQPNFLYYYAIILILLGSGAVLVYKKRHVKLPGLPRLIFPSPGRMKMPSLTPVSDFLGKAKLRISAARQESEGEVMEVKKSGLHPKIKKEIKRIESIIKTLEEQRENGVITAKAFREMKKSNRKKIKELKTSRICPHCSSVIEKDAKFCTECGSRIGGKK